MLLVLWPYIDYSNPSKLFSVCVRAPRIRAFFNVITSGTDYEQIQDVWPAGLGPS